MREAAHEQARRAAELGADDALVQKAVADLLAQNEFGGDLANGYDRAGSLAAYRRAHELDPEDTESRLRTAVVLEHEENGNRYTSGDLDEAIQIYDSIPEKTLREFFDGSFRNNVLFALYWARRHQELDRRLTRMSREDLPADLAVMNAAALRGAEGAIREAERLALSGADLSNALQAGSGTLSQQRNYAEAAKLVEAAVTGSNEASELQSRARLLRKLRKVEVSSLPESSPAQVVTKFMGLLVSGTDDVAAIAKKYLSRRAWHQASESSVKAALVGLRQGARSSTVGPAILGDFAVGGLEVKVEGSDQLGHRVLAKLTYGAPRQFHVYLVREGGKYKVRAFGEQRGELGAEALHAAQQGNHRRARQWLDWARESYRAAGGEDPLRVAPFARLYSPGKKDVLLAAAALTAASPHAARAIPTLEMAHGKTKDPAQKRILEHALALGHANAGDQQKQLHSARSLSRDLPESRVARDLVLGALWELKRYSDYVRELQQILPRADEGEKPDLLRRLASARIAQRRFQAARKINRDLIQSGKANVHVYSNQAWLGLFIGVQAEDLDHALKAVQMKRSASSLHTLACVYADLGRIDEARRTLKQLMDYRKDHVLIPVDWYIVGRMVEQLALPQVARDAYGKVKKPESPWPTSTYALAQSRLKALR